MPWILKPFKQLAGVNFLKKVLRQFHNWFTAPIKQRHTLGWHVFRILYWQSLWIMYEKKNVHMNLMDSSQWGEKQETEKKHLIVLKFRWYTNEDKKITEAIFILCFEFEDTLRSALCPAYCPVQGPKKRGCVWRPAKLCGLKRSQQCNEPQIYICQVLTVNSALCRLLIAGTSVNLYLSNEIQCA